MTIIQLLRLTLGRTVPLAIARRLVESQQQKHVGEYKDGWETLSRSWARHDHLFGIVKTRQNSFFFRLAELL